MQHINTVNGLYKLWICREACVCVTQDDRFTSRNTYNSITFSINFINVINYEKNAVLIRSGKVAFKLFFLNNKCDYPDSEKINEV